MPIASRNAVPALSIWSSSVAIRLCLPSDFKEESSAAFLSLVAGRERSSRKEVIELSSPFSASTTGTLICLGFLFTSFKTSSPSRLSLLGFVKEEDSKSDPVRPSSSLSCIVASAFVGRVIQRLRLAAGLGGKDLGEELSAVGDASLLDESSPSNEAASADMNAPLESTVNPELSEVCVCKFSVSTSSPFGAKFGWSIASTSNFVGESFLGESFSGSDE